MVEACLNVDLTLNDVCIPTRIIRSFNAIAYLVGFQHSTCYLRLSEVKHVGFPTVEAFPLIPYVCHT